VALVVLTGADFYHAYGVFHRGSNDPRVYHADNNSILPIYRNATGTNGPIRFEQRMNGRYAEFVMDANTAMFHRELEATHGYLVFELQTIALLNQLTNQTALLDLKNVGLVASYDAATKQAIWGHRTNCLPRAKFYASIQRYASDEAIRRDLDSGALDYRQTLAVRSDELGTRLPSAVPTPVSSVPPVQFFQINPERYLIQYVANTPGIIFVSEAFFPGWEAVDEHGQSYPIIHAFTAFKGIVIPKAGAGKLTVRFRPASFRLGAGISALTLLLLGGFYGWLIRRENRRPPPAPPAAKQPVLSHARVGIS
jgi:hypothetical protein